MLVNINPVSSIKPLNPLSKSVGFKAISQPNDSFQSTLTPETIARKKFDSLFPNNEIDEIKAVKLIAACKTIPYGNKEVYVTEKGNIEIGNE